LVVRFKKTEPRVVEQRDYHSSTVCDFCGERKVERMRYWPDPIEQTDSEVELSAKLGDIYDGDDRKLEAFDCCPDCWQKKVKPALKALLMPGHEMYEHRWGPYHDSERYPIDPVEP
jgi:hypothetical protein